MLSKKSLKSKAKKVKKVKGILNYIFVDGLSGMALGLFATLIIGTIFEQVAVLIPAPYNGYILAVTTIAKSLTGAGIGAGVAFKYKASPLVGVSAAVAGLVGAFSSGIIAGSEISLTAGKPGDPLAAFVAAFCAVQVGSLISGKTKLDIILTPAVSIAAGSLAGILIGPPASKLTSYIGEAISWGMERQPFVMGIVVSVIMGICLTLPISSAAIGVMLTLTGIEAGAAVVGCCAQMVGFAVSSYRENKFGGLVAQGIGTSMIQMPNIVKHPQIWIPPTVASAILGPISTVVLKMKCDMIGAGMGTSGLVGPLRTYAVMTEAGNSPAVVMIEILVMYFIAPALISLAVSEAMRKLKWIKFGDMKLDNN